MIASNAEAVEEFRAGKEKVITFLIGQVMKNSKGKFNPSLVKELMEKN